MADFIIAHLEGALNKDPRSGAAAAPVLPLTGG
jgi:hypothetical protein